MMVDNVYLTNREIRHSRTLIRRLLMALILVSIIAIICGVTTIVLALENAKLELKVEQLEQTVKQTMAQYTAAVFDHEKKVEQLEQKYITILHMTTDWQEMVATVQNEAGGEGSIGIEHVASTVVNRVKTDHWGPTIHDVISAPGQYSAYGTHIDTPHDNVIAAVDKILIDGPINDAIYYMNPKYSAPSSRSWMRTKPYVLTYKNHEFYGG